MPRAQRRPAPAFAPGGWLDPIARKELYTISRQWQAYVFRGLYVGALGVVLWFAAQEVALTTALSYSAYARMGREIFGMLSSAQTFLLTITALIYSVDQLSREKRERTLPLLALTRLSARQIVVGKWRSCMAYSLVVSLLGLPILAACVYTGGVGIEDLLGTVAGGLTAAAVAGATTLYVSSRCRRAHESAIYSTLALIPVLGASLGCSQMVWNWGGVLGFAIVGLPAAAGFVAISLHSAARRVELAVREGPPAAPHGVIETPRGILSRPIGWQPALYVAYHAPVWERAPLLWKELRSRADLLTRTGTWVAAGVFLLLAFCGASSLALPPFAACLAGLFLLAALQGSAAFAREREERSWDVLLCAPFRARHFVAAKLAVAGLDLVPGFACFGGLLIIAGIAHGVTPGMLQLIGAAVIFAAFLTALALNCSLLLPDTARAFGATVGFAVAILVVLPVGVEILGVYAHSPSIPSQETVLAVTNPFWYLRRACDPTPEGRPRFAEYAQIYGAATVLLLGALVAGFDRLARRVA